MDQWMQEELGRADFGDKRLTKRFVSLVSDLAAKPEASIPQACEDWASTKAAYRFLDHEKVTPEAIRSAHREKTVERVKEYKTVLAVQDTTLLNYTMHQATSGLGPIDGNGSNGMHVHSVLAVSSDGIPLGLVHQQVWNRDPEKKRTKEEHKKLPIEEKESYRWLQSLDATSKAVDVEAHIITVADREADIFELFALPRVSHMDLLIRAVQDRLVQVEGTETRKLWESVKALPAADQLITTHLEHQPGKPARDVFLAVRWRTVQLLVPAKKKKKYEHASVTFTALLVTQVNPPEGETPTSVALAYHLSC